MKKTLVVVSILAGAAGAYAQGEIDWNNGQRGYLISIFSPNPADGLVEQTGNTIYDQPVGAATYGGGWIGGTSGAYPAPANGPGGVNYQLNGNFEVGLYLDTSVSALTTDILTGTPLATTAIQGGANAGQYTTTLLTFTDPSIGPGTNVFVGIAAWDTDGGAVNSLAAAAAANVANVPYGYIESTSFVTLGPAGSPAGLARIGLTSFSLVSIPEPSTVALGVIGASLFLMRLRRRQQGV